MNVHANSIEAFNELDLPKRQRAVFNIFKKAKKSLTDRQVYFKMFPFHGWVCRRFDLSPDLNRVRPRISELVKKGVIQEVGKTVRRGSRGRVRVCMYDPTPGFLNKLEEE